MERAKQVQTKLGFDDARSSSRIPRLLVIFSLLCVVTRREPSRRLDAFVGSFRAIFAHNTEIGRGALQLVTLLVKMHLESVTKLFSQRSSGPTEAGDDAA